MKEYRNKMLKVYSIMEKLKADREAIINSGLQDKKIKEDLEALSDRARVEVKLLNRELEEMANLSVGAAKEIADKYRRKGKNTQLMSYHQSRARDSFAGLDTDQLLSKYSEVIGSLQEDELPYIYVYEDALCSMVRDPSYALAIDETTYKHKCNLEKAAINNIKHRKKFLDNDSTIRGLIEMEVESVSKGEKPAGHDFAELYNELTNK